MDQHDTMCSVVHVFLAVINSAQIVLIAWLTKRARSRDNRRTRRRLPRMTED